MIKKIIGIFIVGIFLFTSIANELGLSKENKKEDFSFTHTVFIEECTASWCPTCPIASEVFHNIFNSGDYPFYYVTLVDDKNPVAKNRNRDYSFGLFKIYAFPTMYFDCGYLNMVGRNENITDTELEYRTLIEQTGLRIPKQELSIDSYITWEGNAKLSVKIKVTNQGNFLYFGKIRSYVTEVESRWVDESGEPYHFGFLDYAINKFVFLMPRETKNFTGIFDGKISHLGKIYPDIEPDNIMVISTISHWLPHYKLGYQSDQYTQRYFAFYTDQTSAAAPIL